MGIGHEREIKEKAAQDRAASDLALAVEETALPLAASQNGISRLGPSDNSWGSGDRVNNIRTELAMNPENGPDERSALE